MTQIKYFALCQYPDIPLPLNRLTLQKKSKFYMLLSTSVVEFGI